MPADFFVVRQKVAEAKGLVLEQEYSKMVDPEAVLALLNAALAEFEKGGNPLPGERPPAPVHQHTPDCDKYCDGHPGGRASHPCCICHPTPGAPWRKSLGEAIGDGIVDSALGDPKNIPKLFRQICEKLVEFKDCHNHLVDRVVELDRELDRHAGVQEKLHLEDEQLRAGLHQLTEWAQRLDNLHHTLVVKFNEQNIFVDGLKNRVGVLEGAYVQHNGKLLSLAELVNNFALVHAGLEKDLQDLKEWRENAHATGHQDLAERVEKLEKMLETYELWKSNVSFHMEKSEKRLKELEG